MGEDWERKSNKAYKRLLQDSGERLRPAPLFLGNEEQVTLYPCQLIGSEFSVAGGARLTLLRHAKRARIAVLDGNRVIGSVSGDAVRDLSKLFDSKRNEIADAVAVEVVSVMDDSVHFEVKAVGRFSRKARRVKR